MRRARGILLACGMAAALLCACNTTRHYKVLSFFFDGVPEPGKTPAETVSGDGKKRGSETAPAAASRYREHGPYAAKQCEACHVRATNRLVLPNEELCFRCHTLDVRKRYLHGPLASGGCTVCHAPHGSIHPYLLVSEPKEFCFHCHDRVALVNRGAHGETETQCTACHDAHGSDDPNLLK
jgi:predicted CXXCH cytochrome family protein